MSKQRWQWPAWGWYVGGIILLAMSLRLFHIGRESLWFDEAVSYMAASLPVPQIIDNTIQSSHPPLYYLLLHFWQQIVPDNDGALRWLGMLWDLLLIPALYWLTMLMFGRRSLAIGAALFAAVSPFHILYSHELRMYTQLMLFVTVGTAVYWRARQSMNWKWWVLCAMVWTAAVYTHLFAFLPLAANGLYALWRYRERRALWFTVILILVVVLLFTPWLVILAGETQTELGSMRPLTQAVMRDWLKLLTTPAFLVFGLSDILPYTAVALFLTLATAVVLLLEWRRIRADGLPDGLVLIGLVLACTLGAPLLLYLVHPFFLPERTMAAGSPFLLILLAWCTTRRHSPLPYLVYGTAVVLAIGVVLYHVHPLIKPPYRDAVAFIAERRQPGDVVLHTSDGSYLPALRYANWLQQAVLAGDPDPRKPKSVYETVGGAVWSREQALAAADRLWLVVALEHSIDWQQAQAVSFSDQFPVLVHQEIGGIDIILYDLSETKQWENQ